MHVLKLGYENVLHVVLGCDSVIVHQHIRNLVKFLILVLRPLHCSTSSHDMHRLQQVRVFNVVQLLT